MATKDEILESIANMTVMEVADLIKAMEEKFGVTAAAAAVAVAAAPAEAAAQEEEKTEFDVIIKSFDAAKKIAAIKAVRAICPELGLGDAKKLVEEGGKVKEGISKADAEAAKAKLEAEGVVIEIK